MKGESFGLLKEYRPVDVFDGYMLTPGTIIRAGEKWSLLERPYSRFTYEEGQDYYKTDYVMDDAEVVLCDDYTLTIDYLNVIEDSPYQEWNTKCYSIEDVLSGEVRIEPKN